MVTILVARSPLREDDVIPREVLERFGVEAGSVTVHRLGHGHIHDTYLVGGLAAPLVIQRISEIAFPEPDRLARNLERVTEALKESHARGRYPLEWPVPIPDDRGNTLVRAAGAAWRATRFIEGTYAIEQVDTPQRARRGARAFGQFCAALVPLDPTHIVELIPDFHDLERRLARLEQAVTDDTEGRVADAVAEIDFCRQQRFLIEPVRAAAEQVPRRVCHNDTKINNLLFDSDDHLPRAVVDLDTCMPGRWMHDFGDIVRTFCSPEAEDSTRLDRVRVRDDVFAAVSAGFVEPLSRHLTADERESLWLGACGIGLVIAVRFLTDHLEGDPYFGAAREGHNLDRARNQLALHRDLTARENELRPHLAG